MRQELCSLLVRQRLGLHDPLLNRLRLGQDASKGWVCDRSEALPDLSSVGQCGVVHGRSERRSRAKACRARLDTFCLARANSEGLNVSTPNAACERRHVHPKGWRRSGFWHQQPSPPGSTCSCSIPRSDQPALRADGPAARLGATRGTAEELNDGGAGGHAADAALAEAKGAVGVTATGPIHTRPSRAAEVLAAVHEERRWAAGRAAAQRHGPLRGVRGSPQNLALIWTDPGAEAGLRYRIRAVAVGSSTCAIRIRFVAHLRRGLGTAAIVASP